MIPVFQVNPGALRIKIFFGDIVKHYKKRMATRSGKIGAAQRQYHLWMCRKSASAFSFRIPSNLPNKDSSPFPSNVWKYSKRLYRNLRASLQPFWDESAVGTLPGLALFFLSEYHECPEKRHADPIHFPSEYVVISKKHRPAANLPAFVMRIKEFSENFPASSAAFSFRI